MSEISHEREAFRRVALLLLKIRSFDDYDVIVQDDWIDQWLKEAAQFTQRLLKAELDFVCPPEKEGYRFTGRDTPIFESPLHDKDK